MAYLRSAAAEACGEKHPILRIRGSTLGAFLPIMTRSSAPLTVTLMLVLALSGHAQQAPAQVFMVDPARTTVEIRLDAFLHIVHGTFHVRQGSITVEPSASDSTSKASGTVVVDAASGNTDNDGRDKNMHRKVLESSKFPEVTFTSIALDGRLAAEGDSQVSIKGVLNLHGQNHDTALPAKIHIALGQWTADADIDVPYVMWGLKNPSNLVLRVKDTVQVHLHAAGTVHPSN